MGNSTSSHGASGGKAGEWKGPFSDQEYDSLVAKFRNISTSSSVTDAQAKLQTLLDIPLSASMPPESTEHIQQLGSAFYHLCLQTQAAEGRAASKPSSLQLIDFVQTIAACVRSSSQTVMRSLFCLFARRRSASIAEDELVQLLLAVLIVADDAQSVNDDPQRSLHVAKQLADAALPVRASSSGDTPRELSSDEFVRWATAQFPLLYSVFVSWLSARCFGAIARPSYAPPQLSHKSDILSRAHFVSLSAVSSPLQRELYRLYTSAQDGLSFNRLSFHLLGYTGPTLAVIRDTDGAVFGMFCDSEWKESTRMYGGNGCFLFRLEPDVRIYRVSASSSGESGFMYLNSKGYALPRGLGMGGNTSKFRLFVSEDLDESSYTTSKCMAFESGRLSSREHLVIDAMEVWGCGDADDVVRQHAFRKDTAEMINRARKVDKAQFIGSDFDKEMFFGKTFGHGADQARVADDEH